MLDLARFVKERYAVVPIVEGWGQVDGQKIYSPKSEDGWYYVKLPQGTIEQKATALQVIRALEPLKKMQVYAVGTEGVPLVFENFKKLGLGQTARIWFMSLPVFSAARVVQWEDNRLYYYEQIGSRNREALRAAREAFEQGQNLLGVRGITPELRYYILLVNLQRETYESLEAFRDWTTAGAFEQGDIQQRLLSFQSNFSVRLRTAIERAGGTYIRHAKRGSEFQVEWSVGGQLLKSHIRDDLRLISAGFCLSGDDKKHTINSIVNLAKLFQQDRPLYITRE